MRNTPKAVGLGKKGFTLIELVVAMVVSTILGVILVTTVRTGVVSYQNINADMMSESEARAALSLITVQVRRHDATGAISVINDGLGMRFIDDPGNEDSAYSEVSFEAGAPLEDGTPTGTLYALAYADSDAEPVKTEIATLTSFSVEPGVDSYGNPAFIVKVEYGNARTLEQVISQRSAA
ncbi:MAG: prepilin-type N-terminal cleavage/methylation domain-containing protein [Clostridiaceae bacterium]|nr:prepilin-type N-terminal cleavage/methylation domain-containing protein [Eubacteriales bacterium]